MPFPVHMVTPVRMSDTKIPPDTENKLESVTNTTLCQAIRQLASILRQAEDLFQDLGSECVKIHARTERINKRIGSLGVTVAAYNPRKQKIPAGDLVTFSRLKAHYTTSYCLDTELFTSDSRPAQVQALYQAARDKAEPQVQRDVSGMMIMPYFSEDCDARKNNTNVDTESCLPRNYEEFTSGMMMDRLRDSSVISTVDGVTGTGELVVVDVSGKTFNRMTDYRRSLQPAVTTRRKRSKRRHRDRRNTLAGGEKFQEGGESQRETGGGRGENKNRSRSQEDGRLGRPCDDGVKEDTADVSLNVTGCSSSLFTGTLPDLSANTSYEERTVSELSCPPNMPLLHTTGEEIRRLRQSLAPAPTLMSPTCSDKETEPLMSPGKTEVMEAHKVRPKSSLSMGVVSDTESLEKGDEDEAGEEVEIEAESPTLMGENNIPFMDDADESVHSCDTEGYYTTFHDFDGFQEVANEYNFDFEIPSCDVKQTAADESELERQQEVVYRKKTRSETRPSPPRRHSSLLRDRESTDTVILVNDPAKPDTEKSRNSLLDFSGTDSDIEVAKHLTSSSLTSRFIPSLCVVTPPVSDTASIINMSRSTSESPGLVTPTPESSDTHHGELSDSVTATDNMEASSSSPTDVSDHSTELGDSGKSLASTETVSSMSGEAETNRLSVTSTSSSVTTASGKLVSTTPDIVKPVKEIGDNKEDVKEVIDKAATKDVMITGSACDNKLLQSSSGSHLPDMLSHTPEMAAAETQSDANPSSATSKPDTGPGVVTTLSGVTSVSRHQPVSQCESGPKLRIVQPFAPYRDIATPLTRHNTRANEKGDKQHHPQPPPSTLSDQGELSRRVEEQQTTPNEINSNPVKTSPAAAVKERSRLVQRSPLRHGATPTKKQSSLETDDAGTSEEQSNLKRSDSYRNAKTILSPNLSQINRKSPEISPSNRIENATYVSFNNITSDKSSSPTMMNEGSLNTTTESCKDDKEKPKQNFFRNIRSQFSTLSLRRKSSKKHESDKSAARDKLQTPPSLSKSEMRRRNSFNSLLRLSGKTPDQPPRLTSTPIDSADKDKAPPTKSQSEPRSRARQHPVNDWKNPPKPQPQLSSSNICHPDPAVEDPEFQPRFLTAAVKNQHQQRQRHSYAEPLYHQPHGSHSALYGYVQPPRSLPPPPYHPPPHHYPPSHHYQPPLYSNYPQQPGSQRSSVSSIYGLYQGPPSGPSSHYGSLSRVGGHVSRVSPGPGHVSRVSSSPPHSDISGSAASSSLSLNNIRQRRPLITSEHSSRDTRGDFVSPSSDYYSLSPASPTPGPTADSGNSNVTQQQQQQPIYARVVKSKQEEEGLVCNQANEANAVINKISDDKDLRAPPQVTRAGKKPLAPARSTSTPDRDSRRHSWAGDKKGPVTPKKTSLQDFKKLLAQQSPGPNPHRPSARELLERSASTSAKAGASESVYGASPGKPAGSLRKRTSPWVDKRFSVIQEEVEGSRENIIE